MRKNLKLGLGCIHKPCGYGRGWGVSQMPLLLSKISKKTGLWMTPIKIRNAPIGSSKEKVSDFDSFFNF